MAAWVEATTRDLSQSGALVNQSKPSVSALSGDMGRPALGPKPHLMPKPFALQRNATVRSIKAPKINPGRQLPRAASTDALDSLNSKKPASGEIWVGIPKTSESIKPNLNGISNVSNKCAAPKPAPLSPKPTPRSPKPAPLSPKPALVTEPTSTPSRNPDRTGSHNPIGSNTKSDVSAISAEDMKKVQPRSRAKSLGSQDQKSLQQNPEVDTRAAEADADVRVSSPCWPARNRLSVELTSRFELPTAPEKDVSSVRRDSETSQADKPPPSPSECRSSKPQVETGEVDDEEISGSSIKRRISLLFDRSTASQHRNTFNKTDVTPAEISEDIKQRIKNLSLDTCEPRVRLPATSAVKCQSNENSESKSDELSSSESSSDKPAQSTPVQNKPPQKPADKPSVRTNVPPGDEAEKNVLMKNKHSTIHSADEPGASVEEEDDVQEENYVDMPLYRRVGIGKDLERKRQEEENQRKEEQLQKERKQQEMERQLEEERKSRQEVERRKVKERKLSEEERRLKEERKQEEEKQKQLEEQRKQEEERKKRIEERKLEEERKREAEREKERLKKEREMEEKRRLEEEERLRQEREKERLKKERETEEKRRLEEEERLRQEREKERLKKEREMEEKRRLEEEERLRQEREKERLKKEREMEEKRRLEEEERLRQEREMERLRKEREIEEKRRLEEEKRLRQEREKERLKKERETEEKRRLEEEERLRQEREKERLKKEREMEEKRRLEEEERLRQEREMERLKKEREMEEKRRLEEEILRQEREKERLKKERETEEKRRLEEERLRQEREKARLNKEREMEEKRRLEEEERLRQEREKERLKKEREMEEKRRLEEEERLRQKREMEKLKKEREIEERRQIKEEERLRQEREKERLENFKVEGIREVPTSYDLICFEDESLVSTSQASAVSRELNEVIYEDFSVKPRRWGTGAGRSSTPSPSREPLTVDAIEDPLESGASDPGSQRLSGHQKSPSTHEEISPGAQTAEETGSEAEDLLKSDTHRREVEATSDGVRPGAVLGSVDVGPSTCMQVQLKGCTELEEEEQETDAVTTETESLIAEIKHTVDDCGFESRVSQALQRLSQVKQRNTSTDSGSVQEEPDTLLFPESSAPLLDSSVFRSKVDLSKKRSIKRSRPSRAVRQRAALPALTEAPNPDWRFCDSTDAQSSNGQNSESEEESPKDTTPTPAPSQPKRVAVFPGMDQSALMAQLRRRSGTVEADVTSEGQTAPAVAARSPRTATMSLGPRVLPPVDGRDSGTGSSPSWLLELKSKKRVSQPESNA